MQQSAETLTNTSIYNIINSDVIPSNIDQFWEKSDILDSLSKKRVLVISSAYNPSSNEETQLNKLLGACKLTENDYSIIQLNDNQKVSSFQIKQNIQPEVILLLGVKPAELGISALFALNAINNFDNIKWIPSVSLTEMEQQAEHKKALWVNALKPTFIE